MTKPDLSYIAEKLRPLARPIEKLQHDPANARRHGRRNSDAIVASLREHGQVKPVVVSSDGTVIAGNGTMDAALSLGWTHLAVVEFAGDARAARRFAVQDNRTAELAEWDDVALSRLLEELREESGSLDSLGFTDAELDKLIASDLDATEIVEDEVPDPPRKAVSRLGDVWTLGRHTLVCGSCVEADRFFAAKSAHLMVTDPPYGVSYVAKLEHLKSRGYGGNTHAPIENDDMKPVELYARAIRNSTDPGDIVYEPFCGSGTAIIASEQLGRLCQSMELSPAYCDVIVERWQNLTGAEATRKSSV